MSKISKELLIGAVITDISQTYVDVTLTDGRKASLIAEGDECAHFVVLSDD